MPSTQSGRCAGGRFGEESIWTRGEHPSGVVNQAIGCTCLGLEKGRAGHPKSRVTGREVIYNIMDRIPKGVSAGGGFPCGTPDIRTCSEGESTGQQGLTAITNGAKCP